jgi:hypothetical protein
MANPAIPYAGQRLPGPFRRRSAGEDEEWAEISRRIAELQREIAALTPSRRVDFSPDDPLDAVQRLEEHIRKSQIEARQLELSLLLERAQWRHEHAAASPAVRPSTAVQVGTPGRRQWAKLAANALIGVGLLAVVGASAVIWTDARGNPFAPPTRGEVLGAYQSNAAPRSVAPPNAALVPLADRARSVPAVNQASNGSGDFAVRARGAAAAAPAPPETVSLAVEEVALLDETETFEVLPAELIGELAEVEAAEETLTAEVTLVNDEALADEGVAVALAVEPEDEETAGNEAPSEAPAAPVSLARATVTARYGGAVLRAGPSTSAPRIRTLTPGTTVELVSGPVGTAPTRWVQVRVGDLTGWISQDTLR